MKIQRHWFVIVSAWLSRIVSVCAQLVAIRIIIGLLGEDQYAAFVLISALSGWFLLTEMGMGSSLQNAISARRAQQHGYSDLITTTLACLLPSTLIWIIILYISSEYISQIYLTDYISIIGENAPKLIFIMGLLFIGVALGTVINKIWYAEQQGWWANTFIATGWLLGLLAVYLLGTQDFFVRNVFTITLCFFLPQSLIGWSLFFIFLFKHLLSAKFIPIKTLPLLLKKSMGFWWFSILAALVLQADYIIMSQLIEKQEIVQYNIVTKVFALAGFIFTAILQALWPVCAEAAELKQWKKLINYKNKYIAIGCLFIILCTILILISRNLITNILAPNEQILLPLTMIIMIGVYQLIRIWCDTYSMLLMSLNYLKPMWILVPLQATFSITFQWFGALYFDYIGLISGLALSFIFTVFFGFPYAFSKYVNHQDNK